MYARDVLSRAAVEMRDVVRGATTTHTHLRDRLVAVALITIAVDVVASVAIFFVERHAKGTEVPTLGDAFFWTSSQLLTISSSLKNPISGLAKALDLFLELYAITVVATMAGSFGTFFTRRSHEREHREAARPPSG